MARTKKSCPCRRSANVMVTAIHKTELVIFSQVDNNLTLRIDADTSLTVCFYHFRELDLLYESRRVALLKYFQ